MDLSTTSILFAFLLTLFAGLSTGIGSFIAFFAKQTNTKFLSVSLGFSAGVMIYVSFVEIFEKSRESLTESLGAGSGNIAAVAAFFGGMLLIGLIDKLVPNFENPHEMRAVEEMEAAPGCQEDGDTSAMEAAAHGGPSKGGPTKVDSPDLKKHKLYRMGILSALAIAIHNFPEGLVTFVSALQNPALGITIAIAVAIHNIPEGIAVSVPIYYATGSKKKAFIYSFLSGLAEPLGALVGFLILLPFMSDLVFGLLFASVAGIMVFISLDQLLPSAEKYGEHHHSILGLIGGMGVMAVSLLLLI